MQRRSFLAAMGIGAAEVICMKKLWAFQGTSPTEHPTITDAVRFKKLHGRMNRELLGRKTFKMFVESQFPSVVAPFNDNRTIMDTVTSWVSSGVVAVAHHRYLVVSGFMSHSADSRGMLWIDATKPRGGAPPLAVLTFLTQQGHNSLWVVPNQPISMLSRHQLPHHFPMTMNRWLRSRKAKREDHGRIQHAIFYEPEVNTASVQASPLLESFGIKRYRTAPGVLSHRLSSGAHAIA
jgi:hypothetical protein